MFNFLFDGKLGEILAPVAGSNSFHLAIQHHRDSEVQNIMSTTSNTNLTQLWDNGMGPIHVACRYNNSYVLEMLLSRGKVDYILLLYYTYILIYMIIIFLILMIGVPVDMRDSSGNTPLHYAAKYGNYEMAKFLIARGCPASTKNTQHQTPYDVSDNHVIRQYLLPLQFQSERDSGSGKDAFAQYNTGAYPGPQMATTTYMLPPTVEIPQHTPAPPGVYSHTGIPSPPIHGSTVPPPYNTPPSAYQQQPATPALPYTGNIMQPNQPSSTVQVSHNIPVVPMHSQGIQIQTGSLSSATPAATPPGPPTSAVPPAISSSQPLYTQHPVYAPIPGLSIASSPPVTAPEPNLGVPTSSTPVAPPSPSYPTQAQAPAPLYVASTNPIGPPPVQTSTQSQSQSQSQPTVSTVHHIIASSANSRTIQPGTRHLFMYTCLCIRINSVYTYNMYPMHRRLPLVGL